MITRFQLPLPPLATDSSSPEFLIDAEQYVHRVRDTYDRRAHEHRRYYRVSGIAVIVVGASLPLLTALSYSYKSLVISIAGVFVAAVTALRAFYRWDQMWALLRATEMLVTSCYWKWRSEIGELRGLAEKPVSEEARNATVRLLTEIADIRGNEAMSFFKELPYPQKQG